MTATRVCAGAEASHGAGFDFLRLVVHQSHSTSTSGIRSGLYSGSEQPHGDFLVGCLFLCTAAHQDLGPKCYSWFVLGQGASGAASGCWQLFQLGERRTAHVSNLYFEDRGTVSYPVWKVHPRSPQARGKNQKHLCEISHLPLAINQKDSKGAFCLSVAWISVPGDARSRPSLMVCSHSTNSITQILLVLLQGGCELLSPQPHPPV